MSAIFGIINFNEQNTDPQIIASMHQAIAYYGLEGQFEYIERNVALAQLQQNTTPESKNEHFPLFDNRHAFVFVSAARIDNRYELFNLLEIDMTLRKEITDAQLMFLAYQKWGNESVKYLLGDWAFAVWHKKEQKLFLARDQHGNTAMYYATANGRLIFSSNIKAILAIQNAEINMQHVSNYLLSNIRSGTDTFYKGIFRLPPAHYVICTKHNIKKTQYWFPENTKIRYKNTNDYYEHFREIFTEAVNCRLRSTGEVGISLSSGLDSTIIAAIAAQTLFGQNKKLFAYTSVPKYESKGFNVKNYYANEGALAAIFASKYSNISHSLISECNNTVLGSVLRLIDIHGFPGRGISNAFWIHEILEKSKNAGCKVLLTGQGGNLTLSWPNIYVKESAANFQHLKFFIKKALWNYFPFQEKLMAEKKLKILNTILNISNVPQFKNIPFSATDTRFYSARKQMLSAGAATIGAYWHEMGNSYGIEVRDPTIDTRVINFCFSIPKQLFIKNGQSRLLAKTGFMDLLPKDLITNKKRGIQAADISWRLSAEKQDIISYLEAASFLKNENSIFKFESIIQLVHNIKPENSEENQFYKPIQLLKIIELIQFLNKSQEHTQFN